MRVRLRNPDRDVEVAGPLTVADLLDHLDVLPHTVLVLHDGALVTAAHELPADAEVEIRPVISGGADGAPRCVVCRAPAVLEERRHRAAWCTAHLEDHIHHQIRKAIDHPPGRPHGERMCSYTDRLLIAVSGGKDSLALWDALITMGYRVDGLYVGLGIGGYSQRSQQVCERFAAERDLPPRRRPGRDLRLHHPRRGERGRPLDLWGLRAVEALRLQPGGRGARL